ncbi:MAG: hypothetical protein C4291_07905 [Candidatus Dadabacteria bacterium]
MLKIIVLVLSITIGIVVISKADEGKSPSVMSVDRLCSKASSDSGFAELKDNELILSGSLSSIENKRKAFLGNKINFIAELIISPTPKNNQYGEVAQTGCTVTCLLGVPGEQCQNNADGELECNEITSPKLQENQRILLSLNSGSPLTVRGILRGKSQVPQYSALGNQVNIVNFVLSGCEIIKVATYDNNTE